MPQQTTLEKFKDCLFDDIETIDATAAEKKRIVIYRHLFTSKLERPYITNAELATSLGDLFGITCVSQAYRYIGHIEVLVGNVRASEKQWIRYMVVEALKEAIRLAKGKDDIKAMVAAADKLGKYTRLDQDDQDPIPWEKIQPLPVEFVNDPSVLDMPEVKNPRAMIERVKKKFLEDEIRDVEYTEPK